MLQWWLFDDSLRKQLWNSNDFDANNIDHYRFCCLLFQNIDESLLLLWCSLKQHSWNTDDLVSTFNDHKCFVFFLLICETLIFHWCFSDVLLMLLWGNLYETAMVWMRTKMIIYVSFLLISEYLMFHCCFIEFFLMSLWRNFNEALMFLIRTLMIRSLFKVLVSEIFMFLHCVSDDSLMILRRSLVDTAEIPMQTVMMICPFEVLIFETRTFLLMFHCCFFDDSLMRHWWAMEISMQTFLVSKDFIALSF